MNRIRTIIASLSLVLLGWAALPAATYAATPTQTACRAITNNAGCNDTSGGPSLNSVVHVIVNIFSLIVGIAAVIMIIIAGLRFITAAGDSSNVASARNTLVYAIIGLVVVALAQFIVQFVLNKVK